MKFLLVFLSVIVLAGCAQERTAGGIEARTAQSLTGNSTYRDAFLDQPLSDLVRLSLRLRDGYREHGDTIAAGRDVAAVGLIALAGAVTYGSTSGTGAERGGLGALAMIGADQLIRFADPASASQAFYRAAQEVGCMSARGADFLSSAGLLERRNMALSAAFMEQLGLAELRLRKNLRRNIPDLETILDKFRGGDAAPLIATPSSARQLSILLSQCEVVDEGEEEA